VLSLPAGWLFIDMFTAVNNSTKANSGTNKYTVHSALYKSIIILDKNELSIKHTKK